MVAAKRPMDDLASQRDPMVERHIAGRGVRDPAVLAAMRSVPRERFLPPDLEEFAYRDSPLPIAQGQTISQPFIVALMTEALRLGPDDRVLEIGTGSGYAAAVLARIAREGDCGCVPVTEECYGSAKVVGMITDRDICMAAYTQGLPLSKIQVGSVMARALCSCRVTDSIATALKILEQNQLHRLLVLDQDQRLMGLLSLADVAREAQREHARPTKEVTDAQVAEVLEAISAPRSPRDVAAAA